MAGDHRVGPAAAARANVAWIALGVLLVWLLGRIGAVVFGAHPAIALRTLLVSHIAVIFLPIALFILWKLQPKILGQALGAVRMIFTIAAFGMIILLPKLAWQALRFEAPEQTSFVNPSLQRATSPQRRVVWILMDELSFHEVFERRPSGLTFPISSASRNTAPRFPNCSRPATTRRKSFRADPRPAGRRRGAHLRPPVSLSRHIPRRVAPLRSGPYPLR